MLVVASDYKGPADVAYGVFGEGSGEFGCCLYLRCGRSTCCDSSVVA